MPEVICAQSLHTKDTLTASGSHNRSKLRATRACMDKGECIHCQTVSPVLALLMNSGTLLTPSDTFGMIMSVILVNLPGNQGNLGLKV